MNTRRMGTRGIATVPSTQAAYEGLTDEQLMANRDDLYAAWTALGRVKGASAMAVTSARMQTEREHRNVMAELNHRGAWA